MSTDELNPVLVKAGQVASGQKTPLSVSAAETKELCRLAIQAVACLETGVDLCVQLADRFQPDELPPALAEFAVQLVHFGLLEVEGEEEGRA